MSKRSYCLDMAAQLTQRAKESKDEEVRAFLYRARDTWIQAANRSDFVQAVDAQPSQPDAALAPAEAAQI